MSPSRGESSGSTRRRQGARHVIIPVTRRGAITPPAPLVSCMRMGDEQDIHANTHCRRKAQGWLEGVRRVRAAWYFVLTRKKGKGAAGMWRTSGGWQAAGGRWQAAGGRWQAAGGGWQAVGSRQQAAGSRQQTSWKSRSMREKVTRGSEYLKTQVEGSKRGNRLHQANTMQDPESERRAQA
ncbi:hypothetical protein C8J57DRAFT_1220376 [Mycena rebaudengoi]|nr:hypothetical protein C8J57DRAFT_1220376 [Mycena rebaudengoi]